MRGKESNARSKRQENGITPAYAGKRVVCPCFLIAEWDHPRVCGEKNAPVADADAGEGSPPRMRGKVLSPALVLSDVGITPAYAGKRRSPAFKCGGTGDHPRVCGEKSSSIMAQVRPVGSPPRMRGKVLLTNGALSIIRITPAYAGKRLFSV